MFNIFINLEIIIINIRYKLNKENIIIKIEYINILNINIKLVWYRYTHIFLE